MLLAAFGYLIGKDGALPDSEKDDSLGYLIGKDGALPDSEKAGSLWVFDWKRWDVA